jgi:hypothetical protein
MTRIGCAPGRGVLGEMHQAGRIERDESHVEQKQNVQHRERSMCARVHARQRAVRRRLQAHGCTLGKMAFLLDLEYFMGPKSLVQLVERWNVTNASSSKTS